MYYESYHWAAIEEYFDDFLCFSTKPTKEKLDANYIFNEDKSVKWNRTEVEKHNKMYDNEVNNLLHQKNRLWNIFVSNLISNIKSEFGLDQTYDVILKSIFIGIMQSLDIYDDDYNDDSIDTHWILNITESETKDAVKLMYNITYEMVNINFGKAK